MGEVKERINFDTLENIREFECCYNKKADALFLQVEPPLPATSVDWDGELWIRINPETGEITGIEIENFKRFFVKKYPFIKSISMEVLKVFLVMLIRGEGGIPTLTGKEFYRNLNKTCAVR